jgi:acyl-CoA thioesterase I
MRKRMLALVILAASATAFSQTAASSCDVHAWSDRDHFREANSKLMEQKPDRRVVFIGATVVESWDLAKSFPEKEYINRGIANQGTGQMLLRFRLDVTQLRPRAVVIFPGLSDLAQGIALADIQENLVMMAQLAKANNVRVLFASAQPVNPTGPHPAAKAVSPEKIRELNRWLFQYARDHADTYVDIWSPLGDQRYVLNSEFTSDGIHPNEAGYKAMVPAVEKRIAEAMLLGVGRAAVKGE